MPLQAASGRKTPDMATANSMTLLNASSLEPLRTAVGHSSGGGRQVLRRTPVPWGSTRISKTNVKPCRWATLSTQSGGRSHLIQLGEDNIFSE